MPDETTPPPQSPSGGNAASVINAQLNRMRKNKADTAFSAINAQLQRFQGIESKKTSDVINAQLQRFQPPVDPNLHGTREHNIVEAYTPSWWERVKDVFKTSYVGRNLGFGESFERERARLIGQMDPVKFHELKEYERTHFGLDELPLLGILPFSHHDDPLDIEGRTPGFFNLSAALTYEEKKKYPNITRFADAISGFTAPESARSQLQWMVGGTLLGPLMGVGLGGASTGAAKAGLPTVAKFLGSPQTLKWAMHGTFWGPMVKDFAEHAYQALRHSDEGDPQHEEGAWGAMAGDLVNLVLLHYGTKGIEAASDVKYTKQLNETVAEKYGKDKKFSDLSMPEKTSVLYSTVERVDPDFRERVNREVAKIQKQRGKAAQERSEKLVDAAAKQVQDREDRLKAAKIVLNQTIERHVRETAYRKQAELREAEVRRQEYARRQAEEREQSAEQRRGFPVEESRTRAGMVRGTLQTTEREPGQQYAPEGKTEPAVPVVDRRAAAGPLPERTPEVVAAESKVQELVEGRMGVSFSALPLSRQVVASRWMERFHPEAWQAFQATPTHATFQNRVEAAALVDAALAHYAKRHELGTPEAVNPNADVQAGLARLILSRTNVADSLKSHPDTYRDLNEKTEQMMGKSFDALDESERVPALAEYLRHNGDKLNAFLTPDLVQRIRSGQHIDLANMEAELADRQQIQVLMEHRDTVRRQMDASLADQMVQEASRQRDADVIDEVRSKATDVTRLASDLGLGPVDSAEDLFRVEKTIRDTTDHLRTPKMREFLSRMTQLRIAAEDAALRRLSEQTAESFRTMDPGEARTKAARMVMEFSSRAADLQDEADRLRAEGETTKAANVQAIAASTKAKADAVETTVQQVANPAPATPSKRFTGRMLVGRETRVVSPRNEEGRPAHYVVIEADDSVASHDPVSWEQTPGYDQNGQPRKYHKEEEKPARLAAETRSQQLDTDILLSNGVTTMDGPSVADQNMHIISGNGRDFSLTLARRKNPEQWARYTQALADRAASFGIDPVQLATFKNPKLVKVLDQPIADSHEWAMLGKDLNDSPSHGINETDQGFVLARMLSGEAQARLAEIVSSLPSIDNKTGKALTVREAMRARAADIASLLIDHKIVPPNKISEYVLNNDLTPRAKDMFESMMAGLTVTNADVLGKASSAVKDKLARAGMFFLQARTSGSNWDLASMNTDAVRLLNRAQDAKARMENMVGAEAAAQELKKPNLVEGRAEKLKQVVGRDESLVEKFLHPERYLDADGVFSFDSQPLHEPVHAGVEALAMALELSPKEYSTLMANYADKAGGTQETMFGAEHPADAFTNMVASKFGLKVIPEEWGAVVGMSDAMRQAIEDGRGPLPVEPEENHAAAASDVQPDSSTVTDVVPEGPKTVQELRKALENHPGYSAEEAAALTEMFDTVLPRAMGESLESLMGNRRLQFVVGGKEKTPEGGEARGYHQILADGSSMIRLCDTADTSTFIHEMTHYLRRYLSPSDQAIADRFVEAKPGEEWTDAQEEKFAQAFERYHYDGGIRRGALEKVFATLHRAMQSVYNAAVALRLAKGTPELNTMFDNWYDWSRAERKPLKARIDVDKLADVAKNGEWPENLKAVDESRKPIRGDANRFVFLDREEADQFIGNRKNGVTAYRMYKEPGKDAIYVWAETKKGKKLYQPSLNEMVELAKKSRDLEAQLRRTTDPREQARLRGALNNIEDKMRGSTGIIGAGAPEPRDTSVIQLVHGLSDLPTEKAPTTPAQAATVEQAAGDPTAISLGGDRGKREGETTTGTVGVREPGSSGKVDEQPGAADREHGAGKPSARGAKISEPDRNPLSKVKAAKLAAPTRERGTPVVDPDKWRDHVEALGLPEGTPPPTVRLDPDIRNMLYYPGQAEAVEGALSALQQYDGTILAGPTGSGKTIMQATIAERLLGQSGDKVGLFVTRSRNLIHEADGFVETARKVGVDVQDLPPDMKDMQTGMYAATYAQIRGNRDLLTVPWDFVLFDESAEARNWTDSEQGKAVTLLGHAADKVVYSSATPYHTVMELGYMHKLGLWPKGGFAEWAQQFGLREVGPNTFSGGTSAKRLEKLRQQLIERGQWQTLYKDMDGVDAHVLVVPQTEEVRTGIRNIRAAFAMARKAFERARMSRYITPAAGHEAIYLKRYIEGQRLIAAIEKVGKPLMAKGWAPIFFSEYRSGAEDGMDFFHYLPGDLGKKINAMLPPLPDVVEAMRKAFGTDIGIFAGEANQVRAGELEQFQSGEKKALYMTYAAGGVGASAHDKVGDKPRAAVFLGLPWSGIMFEQGTGRPWRYGTKSNVLNIFLTSDTLPEMKLLATKILPRMRSLKAAVYGEKMESSLSKSLRESVGIPEEMLQYEHGEESKPDAAEFEKAAEGVNYTRLDDFEIPDAKKAHNKGMKYKGVGRKLYQPPVERNGKRLYQDPKDTDDPFKKLANDAWDDLMGRSKSLPAHAERVLTANEGVIRTEAAEAGRRAMGTGEPVKDAVERRTRDLENDALIWLEELKDKGRAASHLLKTSLWLFGTSGDRAVYKYVTDAGFPKEAEELKRRIVEYDILSGNYVGEFGGMVSKIIDGNRLSQKDLELVSKVVEGQALSNDPRISKAVGEFRKFTAYVRKRLADAGLSVVFYNEQGKRSEYPYSKIEDDPHYWPRMYDWYKKFVITNDDGTKTVTSLGDLMNMPTGSQRRESLIEKYAEQRGISKIKAQLFFDKNARGVRLAGNVESAREYEIPMYGRDRRVLDRYVQQVAEKLAAAEVHGQFREKTDPIIDAIPEEETRRVVNHIITADLDPGRLHDADRLLLKAVNGWEVLSKMALSARKLPFHIAKTALVTNTRSVVLAVLKEASSPKEIRQNAADAGVLTDYIRSAWMREYGMQPGGIAQRMLDFNGFTLLMRESRIFASAAGRLWFEKYAYPELKKDPQNPILRRKLKDLYGMSDEHLDRIAANGYGPGDVRRMELGAANWTTGSGRPSELPPAARNTPEDNPIYKRITSIMRIAQSLHGFMFKTANLVNRTVFQELRYLDFRTMAPYKLIARFSVNFGLAGVALHELLQLQHHWQHSKEEEIEKRRKKWIQAHPISSEHLFSALSNITMGMGVEVLTQLFDELATHDQRDKAKLVQQNRVLNAATQTVVGVPGTDFYNAVKAVNDYRTTFEDTGHHTDSPEERRKKVLERLANEEVPLSRLIVTPKPVLPTRKFPRRGRTSSPLR